MTAQGVPPAEIAERIRIVLARILELDWQQIDENELISGYKDPATGAELDSLDGLRFAVALADEFGLNDPVEIDWVSVNTVRALAILVRDLVQLQQIK